MNTNNWISSWTPGRNTKNFSTAIPAPQTAPQAPASLQCQHPWECTELQDPTHSPKSTAGGTAASPNAQCWSCCFIYLWLLKGFIPATTGQAGKHLSNGKGRLILENHLIQTHCKEGKERVRLCFWEAGRAAQLCVGTTSLVRSSKKQIKPPTSAGVKRGQHCSLPLSCRRGIRGGEGGGTQIYPGFVPMEHPEHWAQHLLLPASSGSTGGTGTSQQRCNDRSLVESLLFHPQQQHTEGPGQNLGTEFTKRTLMAIPAPGAGVFNCLLSALQHHHNEIPLVLNTTATGGWNPPGILFSYQKHKNLYLSWVLWWCETQFWQSQLPAPTLAQPLPSTTEDVHTERTKNQEFI